MAIVITRTMDKNVKVGKVTPDLRKAIKAGFRVITGSLRRSSKFIAPQYREC